MEQAGELPFSARGEPGLQGVNGQPPTLRRRRLWVVVRDLRGRATENRPVGGRRPAWRPVPEARRRQRGLPGSRRDVRDSIGAGHRRRAPVPDHDHDRDKRRNHRPSRRASAPLRRHGGRARLPASPPLRRRLAPARAARSPGTARRRRRSAGGSAPAGGGWISCGNYKRVLDALKPPAGKSSTRGWRVSSTLPRPGPARPSLPRRRRLRRNRGSG